MKLSVHVRIVFKSKQKLFHKLMIIVGILQSFSASLPIATRNRFRSEAKR